MRTEEEVMRQWRKEQEIETLRHVQHVLEACKTPRENMSEHTKGQCLVGNGGRDLFVGDVLIAEVLDTAEGLEGSDAEADANAYRLAACWNAALNIPTKALPRVPPAESQKPRDDDDRDELRKENEMFRVELRHWMTKAASLHEENEQLRVTLARREAMLAVEAAGANPLLTDAIVLLGQAKDKVADFVELHPGCKPPEHLRATLECGTNERPTTTLVAFDRYGAPRGRAEFRADGKWHVQMTEMKSWHVCDTEQAAWNFLTAYGAATIKNEAGCGKPPEPPSPPQPLRMDLLAELRWVQKQLLNMADAGLKGDIPQVVYDLRRYAEHIGKLIDGKPPGPPNPPRPEKPNEIA